MRSFLVVLVVVCPHLIVCESTTNDNEKYIDSGKMPTDSLYCNDLNPQMHLDFNMVN
jgi:hypothetical protein